MTVITIVKICVFFVGGSAMASSAASEKGRRVLCSSAEFAGLLTARSSGATALALVRAHLQKRLGLGPY